jgi:hypothetical protein
MNIKKRLQHEGVLVFLVVYLILRTLLDVWYFVKSGGKHRRVSVLDELG